MTLSSGTYPGYTFKDYTCEDPDVVFADNTDPDTTFTMGVKDVTIQINWTAIPFTVTMADPSCNSVTGGPEFHYGDVVSINCTSSEFVEWSCDDPTVVFADKTSPNTTFTMGLKNITINHSFKSYEVTVEGSTAETTGAGSYLKDATVTIAAGTKDGYRFTGWTSNPSVTFADATNQTTTFTMVGSAVEVTANWELITYNLAINNSEAATTGAGTYAPGATVTIDAGSKAGFNFAGWTVVSGPLPADLNVNLAKTTFTMGSADLTLSANWAEIKYAVTVANAQTTPDGSGSYAPNTTVTINAKADGFHHWEVVSGGVTLASTTSASTTFTMPSGPVSVKAVYNTEVFHTATINGVAAQHYVGEKVAIDAGTKDGYVFDKWTSDPPVEFVDN